MAAVLLLSRDDRMQSALGAEVAGVQCVVVDSLESASSALYDQPFRAVVVHVNIDLLDGLMPEDFFGQLEDLLAGLPLYAVLDEHCPARLRAWAERKSRECLAMPLSGQLMAEILGQCPPQSVDPALYGSELPRRCLAGRTHSLVTFAPSLFTTIEELKVVAVHDVPVLLVGESGTGKSYLARLIHELSPRCEQPLVSLACGTVSAESLSEELLGNVLGADGNEASGKLTGEGTLLLGEVESLGLDLQAKLLRVIETGRYEPVGGSQSCHATARLIMASNASLDDLLREGRFRGDLYYRLSALSFVLPPLRQRPDDLEYFARRFAVEHGRALGIAVRRIDPQFLAALHHHDWPGNLRELEGIIRRAVLYSHDGGLTPDSLPASFRPRAVSRRHEIKTNGNGHAATSKWETLEERVDEMERRIIEESLRRHNFHRIRTARELGISRVTLYNKMKKFGMLNSP